MTNYQRSWLCKRGGVGVGFAVVSYVNAGVGIVMILVVAAATAIVLGTGQTAGDGRHSTRGGAVAR